MLTRGRIIVWATIVGTISLIAGGVLFVRKTLEVPKDTYAMWGAGDLIVEHLKRNTNAWPASWNDLELTYRHLEKEHSELRTNEAGVRRIWDIRMYSTIEEMRSRLQVDWNANVSNLAKAPFTDPVRPFRIVRLLDGKGTHWSGAEPNATIWKYLQTVSNSFPAVRSVPSP
jgi:hypothetical protein